MSTLAETVVGSISELERLCEIGVITPEIKHQLLVVMDQSRTGRLFGHGSAVEFPRNLLTLAATCTDLINTDQSNVERIRESIANKFGDNRVRKPTQLNRILNSVMVEISSHPHPSIIASSINKPRKSWFKKIFQKA